MAFLAQEWRSGSEEIRRSCAMRVMTDGTVFLNRGMVVDEGPPLFHVTTEAGFVNAVPYHFAGAG